MIINHLIYSMVLIHLYTDNRHKSLIIDQRGVKQQTIQHGLINGCKGVRDTKLSRYEMNHRWRNCWDARKPGSGPQHKNKLPFVELSIESVTKVPRAGMELAQLDWVLST